jgi:hypothetical protein
MLSPIVPWSLGPFVPQSLGPFVPQSLSPLVPWSLGPFVPAPLVPLFSKMANQIVNINPINRNSTPNPSIIYPSKSLK